MPAPEPAEPEADYMARCMAHAETVAKYPDHEQRAAVCHAIFAGGEKVVRLLLPAGKRAGKDILRFSASAAPALSAKAGGDTGEVTGYASIFDNVDSQGDIIRRGAFRKSIAERVKAGKVLLMARHFAHGGDTAEAIGQIVEAKEDDRGLWIRAALYASQLAQETRGKIIASPHAYGMSVGYMTVQATDIYTEGKITGKELTELKLYEVTITAMPANEETSAEAKSAAEPTTEALTREEVRQVRALVSGRTPTGEPGDTDWAHLAAQSAAAHSFEAARLKRKRILLRVGN